MPVLHLVPEANRAAVVVVVVVVVVLVSLLLLLELELLDRLDLSLRPAPISDKALPL